MVEDETKNKKTQADIRIVGVGGGGNNAVETMIKEGIQGVQFITVNTDHQALDSSSAQIKVQIGSKLTKGLGAGANPEVGRRAAVESYEEIVKVLKGADMVFITAGMGGGTGTGGAPFVAQAASELGLLTVGIVTTPFLFEGRKRGKQAEQGIQELRNHVDTLIVVPNEKLLTVSKKSAPLLETFKMTDEVLLQAVKGIAELVSVPGL
ncbi:MAG: cell division protein FtsZ, partial [Oligoflexia bacterium]|nr:cell division protein FtsZ [Oligoflexia bacterium]